MLSGKKPNNPLKVADGSLWELTLTAFGQVQSLEAEINL
jgi:hypothetical protein